MFEAVKCPCCGHADEVTNWNPAGHLPPVGSPLVVKIEKGASYDAQVPGGERKTITDSQGLVMRATRVAHIQNKDNEMVYENDVGVLYFGRFAWTHP